MGALVKSLCAEREAHAPLSIDGYLFYGTLIMEVEQMLAFYRTYVSQYAMPLPPMATGNNPEFLYRID